MPITLSQDEFERLIQAWFKDYREQHLGLYAMGANVHERFLQTVIAPLELPDDAYKAAEHAVYIEEAD